MLICSTILVFFPDIMFTFNNAIYKYFHRTGDAAKCLFCKKVLLCKKSSSKGLWTHLKSIHNEKYVKFKKKLEAKRANAVKVPPKKLAQTVMGQKKVYKYLETVKSWEELNKLRFKNHCSFIGLYKRLKNNFKSIITPCSWRVNGKQCEFVLKALRPDLESGTIHVYFFSKHNHPLESDEKRLIRVLPKELMPDANPPPTLRTLDNLEWTFIQTFPDYQQMRQFRHENQCQSLSYDSRWKRVRYSCIRRRSTDLCKFKLMAMRTPTQAYHVYKHGEHNHAACTPKNITKGRKPLTAVAEDPPAAIIRTPDDIEWKFLQTFPDHENMDEFRCENLCSSKPLDTTETTGNGQIRYSCNRRFSTNRCQFQLLAMESANKKGYHVYQHGEHKHPVIKRETEKEQQSTSEGHCQQQNIDKQIKIENEDEDEDEDEEDDDDDDGEGEGEDDDNDNDEDDNGDEDEDDDDSDDSDDSVDDPDYKVEAKRIVPRQKDITRRGTRTSRTNGILKQ